MTSIRRSILLSSLAAAACLIPLAPARAQPARAPLAPCMDDYRELAAKLAESYAEIPVGAGIDRDGRLVSVFASPKSGSWTMVRTTPGGPSCIAAVGGAWATRTPEPDGLPM